MQFAVFRNASPAPKLLSALEHDVALRAGQRKGLAQVLNDPFAETMSRGREVQDPTPMALDHKEAVQHANVNVGTAKKKAAITSR